MNTIIRGGIILGLLVTIFTILYGKTGMHTNLTAAYLFPLVATLIEIGVLVWALRKTAAQGRRWLGQVSAGTMLAFVGGCLIFATSYFYLTLWHPTYIAEINAAGEAYYRAQGMDAAAIQAKMAEAAKYNTPIMQAISGFAGTVVTGLVCSMVIAIFIRSKGPEAA